MGCEEVPGFEAVALGQKVDVPRMALRHTFGWSSGQKRSKSTKCLKKKRRINPKSAKDAQSNYEQGGIEIHHFGSTSIFLRWKRSRLESWRKRRRSCPNIRRREHMRSLQLIPCEYYDVFAIGSEYDCVPLWCVQSAFSNFRYRDDVRRIVCNFYL